MTKTIAILGSTGSIGTQALSIAARHADIRVSALTCRSNIQLLEQQVRQFHPAVAAVLDEQAAADLKVRLSDLPVRVLAGMEGLEEAAVLEENDMVLTAFVGMIGIRPTIAAIEAGKDIALANKETLVTAGHLIMPLAKRKKVRILPVDSEHSAIFQSMEERNRACVEKLLLTASGGPFRGMHRQQLQQVRPADALAHPNWSMGSKITIDSATLVNKALEVMEASWLFEVPQEKIEILVHPQSIIHSMVQYADGAVIAQLGMPDMKLPIQYALFYPERKALDGARVDFCALGSLSFERPDLETFRGLQLGLDAGRQGGSMPVVFNAANEAAVAAFLAEKISFPGIWELIERAMKAHAVLPEPSLEEILNIEQEIRIKIEEWLK